MLRQSPRCLRWDCKSAQSVGVETIGARFAARFADTAVAALTEPDTAVVHEVLLVVVLLVVVLPALVLLVVVVVDQVV